LKRSGIVFFICILLITVIIRIVSLIGPVDPNSDQYMMIRIPSGSTSQQIAEILYNNNLISSPLIFNIVASISDKDHKLQAGYYQLSPADSMWTILKNITKGNIATFRITIPEGFTAEQLVDRLADLTEYDKNQFLQVAKNAAFLEDMLNINKEDTIYKLEGFLYPSTYEIPHDFTPENIMKVFVREFERNWWHKLNNLNLKYTPYEIITIASMIEKEAKLPEEKPLISGVIYNRLEQNMLLQIDATIQYIMEERKEVILYSDLRINSLYNTYLNRGLPPGPICNPGDNALQASINPLETDYLFYFAVNDGSHIFTETYQEHIYELQKYRSDQ